MWWNDKSALQGHHREGAGGGWGRMRSALIQFAMFCSPLRLALLYNLWNAQRPKAKWATEHDRCQAVCQLDTRGFCGGTCLGASRKGQMGWGRLMESREKMEVKWCMWMWLQLILSLTVSVFISRKMVIWLYLYRAFLVLPTTQSTFTLKFTHTFLTTLFYALLPLS